MEGFFFLAREDDPKRRCWGPFGTEAEVKKRWERMNSYGSNYSVLQVHATGFQRWDRIDDFAPWLDAKATALRSDDV